MIKSAGYIVASMVDQTMDATLDAFFLTRMRTRGLHSDAHSPQQRQRIRTLHLAQALKSAIRSWIPNPLMGNMARDIILTTPEAFQQLADWMSFLLPVAGNSVSWRELQNKFEVFQLFEYADSILAVREGLTCEQLPYCIALASQLDPYYGLWVIEGLGHHYCECNFSSAQNKSLFALRDEFDLDARCLIPLHAGMGLSLAARSFSQLNHESPASKVRGAIRHFLLLCDRHARRGYTAAAVEALGLVAYQFHLSLLEKIDGELQDIEPQAVGYFWHGVGRALYFDPSNILPTTASVCSLKVSQRLPPHEVGRGNAMAGLAWAIALVNLRHPEVLERFLEIHGQWLPNRLAFSDGMTAALTMWQDFSGLGPLASALFCNSKNCREYQTAQLWEELVCPPCKFPRHQTVDELFQYEPRRCDEKCLQPGGAALPENQINGAQDASGR
jgi:hypothetical protein